MSEEVKDSSFELRWGYFFLGLVLGVFGLIAAAFAVQDRRDKVYSTLFGASISLAVNFLLIYYKTRS